MTVPSIAQVTRPRRLPRAERERLMLEEAIEAFASRGYEAVSMNEIASRAGVTKPMVYSYFGSKQGLYAACIRRTAEEMVSFVREAARPEESPDLQLWAGIVAQLRFIEENRDRWRVMVREAATRGRPATEALEEGGRRVNEMLADLYGVVLERRGGGAPPRKELLAQAAALQGAVGQVALWWEQHPAEPLEAVALRIMNFVWQGLGQLLGGEVWVPPPPGSRGELPA